MATDSSYLAESDDEDEGSRSIARMRLKEALERLKVAEGCRGFKLQGDPTTKNEELDQVNLELESTNYANARLEEGCDDMTNKVQSLKTASEYWRKKAEETTNDNTLGALQPMFQVDILHLHSRNAAFTRRGRESKESRNGKIDIH
ncbi:hypothetical protein BDQ17DRAFT_1425668 [Cyathus striatus]|nr:hypothetical protein BDQ17DRAFT_1425668 [Cyathus striatus]